MTTKPTPSSAPPVACKDCRATGITTARPLKKRPDGGQYPRCNTHHREFTKAGKKRAAERRDAKVYGLAPATDDHPSEYDRIYAAQGGRCAICGKATGKARRLAVDHDHDTGTVRGLLCKPCNRTVLGHGGELIARAAAYLADPPAPRALGRTITVPDRTPRPARTGA